MIRVYYLKTEIKDNTECCIGQQYIHDAILGIAGILRKLIQDTTEPEHNELIKVVESWREATKEESEQLSMGTEYTSTPVRDLAKEIDDLKSRLGKLEAAKIV